MSEIKKYLVKVDYTEESKGSADMTVYARDNSDAIQIARMKFLDSRRDEPIVTGLFIIDNPR